MDLGTWVTIGLFLVGGVSVVVWYFIRRVLRGLELNAGAIGKCASQEQVDALEKELSDSKIEALKLFVSSPELTRVMSGLDRTLQQMMNVLDGNSKESREGMNALNKRIDDLVRRP